MTEGHTPHLTTSDDPWVGALVPHPLSPRQAGYTAAGRIIEAEPSTPAADNRLWRAVIDALDAADITTRPPAHPIRAHLRHALRRAPWASIPTPAPGSPRSLGYAAANRVLATNPSTTEDDERLGRAVLAALDAADADATPPGDPRANPLRPLARLLPWCC